MPLQAPFFLAFATTIMANGLVKRQGPDINEDDIPSQCQNNLDCSYFLDHVRSCDPINPPFSKDHAFQDCICLDVAALDYLSGCLQCTHQYKNGGDIRTIYDICSTYSSSFESS
ncbi:Ecp19-2 [Fulvia fulva]|uniref:Ecp19-2 n=1 Tax=Passalora fulva TaxID=5499 RepID=A0A9Q8PGU3_PASFU|nr:Ecp19-2 [Fulvia fulva]KAK4613502.1 Ecp19-2 [Fulvia fulva]KAK4614777.1 Ecp19-2 [Fulvia fulva]UJO22147.1 Ecp19-2 [Fulvia fulva]WPV20319.1 Ecp19-2 [Fulvia fulva]WPV35699.1 Ecp19-2 [Fulvia fulva]